MCKSEFCAIRKVVGFECSRSYNWNTDGFLTASTLSRGPRNGKVVVVVIVVVLGELFGNILSISPLLTNFVTVITW